MAANPSPNESVEKPASDRLVLSDSRNRSSSSMTSMRPRVDSDSTWCIGLCRQNTADTDFRHGELCSIAVDAAIFECMKRRCFQIGIEEYLERTIRRGKCPHQRDVALADLAGRAQNLLHRRRIKTDQAVG